MHGPASRRPANEPLTDRAALLPLLRELGHLKRIGSAGREGSIAARLFAAAWAALVAGQPLAHVAERTVAAALAAARLGDLDHHQLAALGLGARDTADVLGRAFDLVTDAVDLRLAGDLRAALGKPLEAGIPPPFVQRLAEQPRAGVTCPGRPRIMLQPAENHAEHCLMVAVYGVLFAPSFGARVDRVFLAGLAHHLHNADMPDSGFTGEMLLEPRLAALIEAARERALGELAPGLRGEVVSALWPIAADHTAEARAFHAADSTDRVLEIEQHLVARSVTMDVVLGEYELVHEGPVRAFQEGVLGELGLL